MAYLLLPRSNSACYASVKDWQKALDDALISVSKDPKFIKGYYRLSSAQLELKLFDDAEATLKKALSIEPGDSLDRYTNLHSPFYGLDNEVISRQLKVVKSKREAAFVTKTKGKKGPKQLDESQVKEVLVSAIFISSNI